MDKQETLEFARESINMLVALRRDGGGKEDKGRGGQNRSDAFRLGALPEKCGARNPHP
jgi:hypothetical protein